MANDQERVPTGINGIDELLSGGYIRKSMNLLRKPCSGKKHTGNAVHNKRSRKAQ